MKVINYLILKKLLLNGVHAGSMRVAGFLQTMSITSASFITFIAQYKLCVL